jgi:hypothetical protein
MNLYKGVSIIFQTVASAGAFMPFARPFDIVTFDNTEAALQIKRRRDVLRHQARKRAASLKQIDVNQLPLVATDRSVIERALNEAEPSAAHSESPARSNGWSRERKFDATTTTVKKSWQFKELAAEIQFNMEIIQ